MQRVIRAIVHAMQLFIYLLTYLVIEIKIREVYAVSQTWNIGCLRSGLD